MFSTNNNFGKESQNSIFHKWAVGTTIFRILTEEKEIYNKLYDRNEIKCNAFIISENGKSVNEVKIVSINAAIGNAYKEAFLSGLYTESYPMKNDTILKRIGTTKEDTKYTVLLSPNADNAAQYLQMEVHEIKSDAAVSPSTQGNNLDAYIKDVGGQKMYNQVSKEAPNPEDIPF